MLKLVCNGTMCKCNSGTNFLQVAYAKHLEDNLQKHLDISMEIKDKLREEFDIRDEMARYR